MILFLTSVSIFITNFKNSLSGRVSLFCYLSGFFSCSSGWEELLWLFIFPVSLSLFHIFIWNSYLLWSWDRFIWERPCVGCVPVASVGRLDLTGMPGTSFTARAGRCHLGGAGACTGWRGFLLSGSARKLLERKPWGHALAGLLPLTVCLPSSCWRAFAPKEGSAEESGARVPTEVCLCRHLWLCSGIAQACIFPLLWWYQI